MRAITSFFFSRASLVGFLVLGLAFASFSPAKADVREVSGEVLFGPETSESKACEAAEQKAKQEALRQVLGERFSVSEQLSCREGKAGTDNPDCVYNTFLWSEIDGDVKQAVRLGNPVVDKTLGASRCIVTMRVEVVQPNTAPDPSFDFQVLLSSIRLREGEALSFSVKPTAPMHLAIFGWAPSHDKKTVTRIFPNAFDSEALLRAQQQNSIPSELGSRRYGFQASFPAGLKQDYVDEYLIFVATNRPIAWLESYEFEQFRARIREISPPDKRVVKRSYRIIN
ncbi:MAG: hypothetical protein RLZZ133_32 [Pseudomonadota bacterium]|jgi:hypothetical protein